MAPSSMLLPDCAAWIDSVVKKSPGGN